MTSSDKSVDMLPVVLYGGGGQGRIAQDALLATDRAVAGVVDQVQPVGIRLPWLGDEDKALSSHGHLPWHIAIGDNALRDEILRRVAERLTLSPLVIAHPAAVLGTEVNLGPGTFLAAGSIVAQGARLGPGCLVNHGATVDHDNVLGRCVHVAPGAHLAGQVRVGDRTLIGVGSIVIPGIVIGADVTVGAGAVVIHDVPDGSVVVGNPARLLKTDI